MPIRLVVVAWRRCRASARTDRQRTKRRSSPCRRNASGSAISATDRKTDGATSGACVSMTRWTHRMRWIDRKRPTRHASASKPARSTEWQLGTLNGLVGVVVVVYTDPPRVSPATPTPTQRPACHADRVSRLAGFAVQRGGASARTHGWDTIAPVSQKHGG